MNDGKLLVLFTNPMTPAQKKGIMRRCEARKSKVKALFRFYCDNNVLYRHVTDTAESIQQKQTLPHATQETLNEMLIVHTAEDQQAAINISGEKHNICRAKVFDEAKNEIEEL